MADAQRLTIEAPEQVDAPLTEWDIAFASGQPDTELPDFVTEVAVTFETPQAGDVVLAVDGPGVLSPLTATRHAGVRCGSSVTSRWRWAAPLRPKAPPYDLPLTATPTW